MFDFFASGYAGKFKHAFPKCFINMNNELIIHPSRNSYFGLDNIKNETELKAKVLEWLSRDAIKGGSRASQKCYLEGINEVLETDFDENDMEVIYTYLGNSINHSKTIRFIESGYDLAVLEEEPKEQSGNKTYVAVFNYFGDLTVLADKLGGAVVENTICLTDTSGQEISDLMERNGLDYNYGGTPEEAQQTVTEKLDRLKGRLERRKDHEQQQ